MEARTRKVDKKMLRLEVKVWGSAQMTEGWTSKQEGGDGRGEEKRQTQV